MEYRTAGVVKMRPAPGGGRLFTGVIPFNRRSGPIRAGASGPFVEEIAPSAFSRSLAAGADVMALVDHDPAKLLGRSAAGTLRMRQDANALSFEIDAPDTTYSHDVAALLERGDVAGSSFSFRVPSGGDRWSYTDGGQPLRRLVDVDLIDVTVTATPAYPSSTAAVTEGAMSTTKSTPPSRLGVTVDKLVPAATAPRSVTEVMAEHRRNEMMNNRRRLALYRRRH